METSILQQQPTDFIELAFNENLWSKQKEIVNSVRDNKYTSVRSCFDVGKSFVSARLALWFLYSFPNSKVITTAPTFRQVKDILWRELHSAKDKSRIQLGGQLNDTSLDVGSDWFAVGISTNDSTNFQGYHAVYVLVIIDEAAGVEEQIFNASEGLLASDKARVLYIGNPTNTSGTFFNSFKLPQYSKIHISAFDTPNFTTFGITMDDIRNNTWAEKMTSELPAPYLVTPSWVYDKFLRWGEESPMFQSLVLGDFPQEGEDTLIPLRYIEQARLRTLDVLETDKEQSGLDVARFGSDKSVFAYRKGPKVLAMKERSHSETMQTAQWAVDNVSLYPNSSLSVDVVGIGAGVYDRAKQLLVDKQTVNEVNVGLPARDSEQFANSRAELFWGLRERFIDGSIDLSSLPKDMYEDLASQLSNIKFKYTTKNQIQLESKEDMKKRGLPSPDKADSLALAFGEPKHTKHSFVVLDENTARFAAPVQNSPKMTDEERKRAELEADLAIIQQQAKQRNQ